MNRRGFAHPEILIVIALIAIVGVVVFVVSRNSGLLMVSQRNDDSSVEQDDWKTYAAEVGEDGLKYSIKYPKQLILSRGNCDTFVYPKDEDERESIVGIKNSGIEIGYTIEGLEFGFCITAPPVDDSSFISTSLDGYDGMKSEADGYGEYFINTPGGKTLRVWYRMGDEKYKEVFNEILSTFQFIDPS